MDCFYHPDKSAVGVCQACGRGLCKECQNIRYGRVLCSSCLKEVPPHWFNFHIGFPDLGRFMREFIHFSYHCPECGRPIKPDFKVCPYCKTDLASECPNCHKQMEHGWVVCPYCGGKIKDEEK